MTGEARSAPDGRRVRRCPTSRGDPTAATALRTKPRIQVAAFRRRSRSRALTRTTTRRRLRTPADRQGVPWSGNGPRRGLDVEPGAGEAVRGVSATGQLFQPFRIAVALHREGRDGALDFTQIVGSHFDSSRSD